MRELSLVNMDLRLQNLQNKGDSNQACKIISSHIEHSKNI